MSNGPQVDTKREIERTRGQNKASATSSSGQRDRADALEGREREKSLANGTLLSPEDRRSLLDAKSKDQNGVGLYYTSTGLNVGIIHYNGLIEAVTAIPKQFSVEFLDHNKATWNAYRYDEDGKFVQHEVYRSKKEPEKIYRGLSAEKRGDRVLKDIVQTNKEDTTGEFFRSRGQ